MPRTMPVHCDGTDSMSSTSWSNGTEHHRASKTQVRQPMERDIGPSLSRSGTTSLSFVVKSEPSESNDMNRKLTSASSPRSRHPSPPTLPARQKPFSSPHSASAISGSYNTYTYNSQDVHSLPVNVSSLFKINNTQQPRSNVFSNRRTTESINFRPPPTPSHNVAINTPDPRQRTSQVFYSTSDLAAHYGIPTFLPPAPRTTPRREPQQPDISHEPEFADLCSNYLTMLSQTPGDTTPTEDAAMTAASVNTSTADTEYPPAAQQQEAVQELMDVFQASPEFQFLADDSGFGEYLTSPFDDSPLDEMLTTPALMSNDLGDIYTSPLMGDDWPGPAYTGSLFNDQYGFLPETTKQPAPAVTPAPAAATISPAHMDLSAMWSFSPTTPALEHSPLPLPVKSLPATRRKSTATGTRKNVTPETLVPIDAPTQARNYVTPSATSRKEVPAVFARKRARSQAFGDEEDQLDEEVVTLPLNPTEADLIEAKRRQNTIAARRSRKRKLEYQRELEDSLDAMKEERDMWKNRAMTYHALLKSHGHEAPEL